MLSKIASIPQKYIVLGAAVIFLVAFLGAFLSYGNFWSNTTVDVPNVVGKQVSVAKNILEDKHLRVSTSEVTNPDVPAGQVISQTPGGWRKRLKNNVQFTLLYLKVLVILQYRICLV